jgi:hypothetical protein
MHIATFQWKRLVGSKFPMGLPIIFDLQSKCVKLLDDGTGRDRSSRSSQLRAASLSLSLVPARRQSGRELRYTIWKTTCISF